MVKYLNRSFTTEHSTPKKPISLLSLGGKIWFTSGEKMTFPSTNTDRTITENKSIVSDPPKLYEFHCLPYLKLCNNTTWLPGNKNASKIKEKQKFEQVTNMEKNLFFFDQ